MQNTWAWVIGGIIVIAAIAWFIFGMQPSATTDQNSTTGTSETGANVGNDTGTTGTVGGTVGAPMTATVTYDGTTFSPSTVTIKKGGTVAWNNEGTNPMWIASAQHPNHTVYSGTSRIAHCPDTSKTAFDQCQGGNNYTFKFDKVGTWNYHDHLNPAAFGSVTVVE